MPKTEIIAELWDRYRREVLPSDAPSVQVRETRMAFYAGGRALVAVIEQLLDPEAEPTDADVAMMEGIYRELETFAKQVEAGRN